MNHVFLLLGSNLGNREENLKNAAAFLKVRCGPVTRSSALYQTAAWGKTDQPPFLNQAIEISTILPPAELMKEILEIEKEMGRERKEKYGPRLIDIDILMYDEQRIELSFLKIPHPEMQRRRFALVPLSEIAGQLIHPVLGKSIATLLNECTDELPVNKYQPA